MAVVQTLPKEVSKIGSEVKLFGKWDTQECVFSVDDNGVNTDFIVTLNAQC